MVLFIVIYKVVVIFAAMRVILKCDHSNESYWVVRSRGVLCYFIQGGYNF